MRALIVIDMLDDFVTGPLANEERAMAIVPSIQRLLAHARASDDWTVVFANDAHRAGDPELRVWGEHAMEGTPGAQVIAELLPQPGPDEIVSPKRGYSAFGGTGLLEDLRARGADEVVLTGQHTHCCVRHTAYDAFDADLRVVVPADGVAAFAGVDQDEALEYLRAIYGATVTTSDALVGEGAAVGA